MKKSRYNRSGKNNPNYGKKHPGLNLGRKHSEETKEKIKEKRKLQIFTENTRKKISLARKGKTYEEIFGKEKAEKLLKIRKEYMFKNNPMKGKHHSIASKEKNALSQRNQSNETRRKRRESRIKFIEKNCKNIAPRIGKYEKKILDILEECFHYPILRQYRVVGYFLDGYCPALHLAIEIDGRGHNFVEQLKKDLYRQRIIEKELCCSFIRIKI